jgi:hypothetical protein
MPRLPASALLGSFLVRLWVVPLCCWVWLAPSAAHAGSEPRVESSSTVLELDANGGALIRHELRVVVRGAPFVALTLRGVDPDAQPLGDGTVTRLSDTPEQSLAQPLAVRASDGQLELTAPGPRGLRGNRFLLTFAYRTHLLEQGAIRPLAEKDRLELSWVGPRFDDGVDSVTLLVRARAAARPPELAPRREDDTYGMVMSSLRRTRDSDELELVRTHIARDEAMRWSVLVDRGAFEQAPLAADGELPSSLASPASVLPRPAPRHLLGLAAVVGLGLVYLLLVVLKSRAASAAAAARGSQARPWIAAGTAWRACAAGVGMSAATAAAAWGEPPWMAALALLVAMAFAAFHPPLAPSTLRGPGEWRPLESSALGARPRASLPGAWLDAGRARGFTLLCALLALVIVGATRAFESSPYAGACVLLGGAALLPIFCTGRAGELPLEALDRTRSFLADVARRLGRDGSLVIQPIGRMAASNGEVDELRLSITPSRPVPGLLGLELGVELRERLGGHSARPVVVVRAAEGSDCQRALPRGITWTRGRSAEERAGLVRPKLPDAATSVALIQELASLMLSPPSPEPAAKKAARSAGSGLSTAKAGTRSSPAHAT